MIERALGWCRPDFLTLAKPPGAIDFYQPQFLQQFPSER
jgi:hypothetical protein